jgi:hypothetical protein
MISYGQSWDELERDAQMEDKMKRAAGDEGQDHVNKKRKTGR